MKLACTQFVPAKITRAVSRPHSRTRFSLKHYVAKIFGLTIGAGLGVYLYALIQNPNAADGDPAFWGWLGAAAALFVAAVGVTARRQARRAVQ